MGRVADAVFRLTFLLRGRVPGGTAAAAQLQYAAIQAEGPVSAYYGRVFRRGSYTVLSYQFFYAMNDWRSSFFGVNDHEADWEQVFVYLSRATDGDLVPAWIAYASHDFRGADLRRRWDDPRITIVDNHPVVFIGAGSHASYFESGEYVITVELKALKPLSDLARFLRRFWRNTLGQGDPEGLVREADALVQFPFVDYARGDGVRIGPGQMQEWTPALIDESIGWVSGYRGLWGLDTHDLFAGELAPAGPRYNRDGSVRQSWYDPIGWAELDREPAPAEADAELSRHVQRLRSDATEAAEKSAAIRAVLPRLSLEAQALTGRGSPPRLLDQRLRQIESLEKDLLSLASQEEQLRAAAGACEELQERMQAGYRPGPREHIRHERTPEPAQNFREGRVAELWAAASIGLLFVLAVIFIVLGTPWFSAFFILIGGSILVDNILRGTVVHFLLNAAIVLALITGLVLLYEFVWWVVLAGLAASGLIVLTNNLRELREH
jgi:hypothetical protein